MGGAPGDRAQGEERKVAAEEGEGRRRRGRGGEDTLASPGMPADHERCRYDGFTFYSLPTGRFTPTVHLQRPRVIYLPIPLRPIASPLSLP